jgi:hypothetical protein
MEDWEEAVREDEVPSPPRRNHDDDDDPLFLDDIWSLYFHDPSDPDWTLASYTRICNVSCAEEFWGAHRLLQRHLDRGIFFLMREHVFPCWDDPANIRGGCLTFMVARPRVPDTWEHLASRMMCDRLARDPERAESVNGISISPKRDFTVIKIWLAEGEEMGRSELFDLPPDCSSGMFRLNLQKIAGVAR